MRNMVGRNSHKEVVLILVMGIGIGILAFFGVFMRSYNNSNQGVSKKDNEGPLINVEPEETSFPLQTDKPSLNESVSKEDDKEISIYPTPNIPLSPKFKAEDEVVSYFTDYERIVDSSKNTNDKGLVDTVKSGFIKMIDFLFYDTEIGGYKFSELATATKLKIIKIALTVDNTIDKYLPNYKDSIKSGYVKITSKLVKAYLNTTSLLCDKVGEVTCNYAKEDFKNMKKSFSFTFGLIKEAGGSVKEAIKTWYQIFSEKE